MATELSDIFPGSFVHLNNDVDPRFLATIGNRDSSCAFGVAHAGNPLVVTL
jgi:hypothetical protein